MLHEVVVEDRDVASLPIEVESKLIRPAGDPVAQFDRNCIPISELNGRFGIIARVTPRARRHELIEERASSVGEFENDGQARRDHHKIPILPIP